jgi:hypothetical protein
LNDGLILSIALAVAVRNTSGSEAIAFDLTMHKNDIAS